MLDIKRRISQQLIPALRKNGSAFDAVKFVNKRSLKINIFLDEDDVPLGETYTPYLKYNQRLKITFFSKFLLLQDDKDNDILKISNYLDNIEYTTNSIKEYYDTYFYELSEIQELLKFRSDFDKIDKVLNIFYPHLKVRTYGIVESYLYLFFGSGIFSFEIKTSDTNKKLCNIKIQFYGTASGKYQSNKYSQMWNLHVKYRSLVSFSYTPLDVNNFNFGRYVKAYLKSKTV